MTLGRGVTWVLLILLSYICSAQTTIQGGVVLKGGVVISTITTTPTPTPTPTPTLTFNIPLTSLTASNSSACLANGLPTGCTSAFAGLTDHCSQSSPSSCDPNTHSYSSPGPPTTAPATNTQTVTTVPAPSNINLSDIRSMLYPGFNGKVLCVHQPWFGNGQHIAIGKNGSSATVVSHERDELIAMGCDVVVLNWYGQGSFPDTVTQTWRTDLDTCRATLAGGCLKMTFQADHNTITGGTISGFETDVTYTFNNYMNHSSWWTITFGGNTRPVYITFGWGNTLADSDWGTIKTFIHTNLATGAGEPVLIAEGTNGLAAYANLDGGNGWVGADNYSNTSPGSVTTQGILGTGQYNTHFQSGNSFSTDSFISTAQANVGNGRVQIIPAVVGFNDTPACWGFAPGICDSSSSHPQGRKNARQCGQVWVNSLDRSRVKGYSSSLQAKYIMVVTLSDYEEGTAIEPGIDGCYNISNALSGKNLTILLQPTDMTFSNLSTVKAIEVYATIDNSNLALLTTLPAASSQVLDLTTLGLTPGQLYKIYTRKVGKPMINNKLSTSVDYTR